MMSHGSSTTRNDLASLKIAILIISILAIIFVFSWSPIEQEQAFHQFADSRKYLNTPNCWNVWSNLGFLVVGIMGLIKLMLQRSLAVIPSMKQAYVVFFLGICLVAIGSSYYHLRPDNLTLVWDRAPMTITFMALLAIALTEYVSIGWGKNSLWPIIAVGQLSVYYWYRSEGWGHGDLRPYMIVQFLPALLIPVMIVMGKSRFQQSWGYWIVLLAYVLAKLAERFDDFIYRFTIHAIGGHALKHIIIAAGLLGLILYYEHRAVRVQRGIGDTCHDIQSSLL